MGNTYNPSANIWEEMKMNDFKKDNTIYLYDEVDRESVSIVIRQLRKACESELLKTDRKPIKIRIMSYGGSIYDMFGLISMMEYYKEKGLIIETYCDGYACSAGAKILMSGSKGHRYTTRRGLILIHQIQFTNYGHQTLQERRREMLDNEKDWKEICQIFKDNTNLSDEEIDKLTSDNLDVSYRPQEALEKGLVDIIL